MTGWKTKLGAVGIAATGVAMIVEGLVGEAVDPTKVWEGITIISGALAVVGIGHKIEKGAK